MGQEITIKPGELFELNTTDLNGFDLTNRFVKGAKFISKCNFERISFRRIS